MNRFDLQSHLDTIYATYPEANHQPIIGITANYTEGDATLRDRYYKQVVAAGGTPLLIPPVADKDVIINTLEHIDGLLLTGGGDYNPLWGDEEPSPKLHSINAERDLPELLITQLAYNRQIPMLGICRGIQTLALALGGKVIQNIDASIKHSQDADRNLPTHSVILLKDSTLFNIYREDEIFVNSFHHQAVGDAGESFPCGCHIERWHRGGDGKHRIQARFGCAMASRMARRRGLKALQMACGEGFGICFRKVTT
jgi:membrane dipeptidase